MAESSVAAAMAAGALNVVVEGAELVSVTGQKSGGIRTGKVLPLQKNVRPALLHAVDENDPRKRRILRRGSDDVVQPI